MRYILILIMIAMIATLGGGCAQYKHYVCADKDMIDCQIDVMLGVIAQQHGAK